MGFFIEVIIYFLVIWFSYPFLKDRVVSIIEKRKELKQKHLSPRKQLEQFAKTTEGLDRALDKFFIEKQKRGELWQKR